MSGEFKPLLREVARVSDFLWTKGWAERNAGNLTLDVSERRFPPAGKRPRVPFGRAYPALAGRALFVTGSGRRFRDLSQDPESNACVLRIDTKGAGGVVVWGGRGEAFKPTSELPSHLALHERLRASGRKERAVLHTHPLELIALSHVPDYGKEAALNGALFGIHPEVRVVLPMGIGLCPYELPGSEAQADLTLSAFDRGFSVVLWQWHGVVACGEDVTEAFDRIDTLNKAAQILFLCRSAGIRPKGMPLAAQEALARAFNLPFHG